MGIDLSKTTEKFRALIEPESLPVPLLKKAPERQSRLERDEQRIFANWLLAHDLPRCWHATHKRSTATTGVFDFWVGKAGRSIWLEFKRDSSTSLRPEQELFRAQLAAQTLEWHVVTSAAEAIEIVRGWK